MILSATGLNLAPQKDRNNDGILDDWTPPAGAGAVWTSGRLWGIYANNDVMFGDAHNGAALTAKYEGDDIRHGDFGPVNDGIPSCLPHQLNRSFNQGLAHTYN